MTALDVMDVQMWRAYLCVLTIESFRIVQEPCHILIILKALKFLFSTSCVKTCKHFHRDRY
jgi:hypothetical protein